MYTKFTALFAELLAVQTQTEHTTISKQISDLVLQKDFSDYLPIMFEDIFLSLEKSTDKEKIQASIQQLLSFFVPQLDSKTKAIFLDVWLKKFGQATDDNTVKPLFLALKLAVSAEDIKRHEIIQNFLYSRITQVIAEIANEQSVEVYFSRIAECLPYFSEKTSEKLMHYLIYKIDINFFRDIIVNLLASWPTDMQIIFVDLFYPFLIKGRSESHHEGLIDSLKSISGQLTKEAHSHFISLLYRDAYDLKKVSNRSVPKEVLVFCLQKIAGISPKKIPGNEIYQLFVPDNPYRIRLSSENEPVRLVEKEINLKKEDDLFVAYLSSGEKRILKFRSELHDQLSALFQQIESAEYESPNTLLYETIQLYCVTEDDKVILLKNILGALSAKSCHEFLSYFRINFLTFFETIIPEILLTQVAEKYEQIMHVDESDEKSVKIFNNYQTKLQSIIQQYRISTALHAKFAVIACKILLNPKEDSEKFLATLLELLDQDAAVSQQFLKIFSLENFVSLLFFELINKNNLNESIDKTISIIYESTTEKKPFRWECLYSMACFFLTNLNELTEDLHKHRSKYLLEKCNQILFSIETSYFAPKELKEDVIAIKRRLHDMPSKDNNGNNIELTAPLIIDSIVDKINNSKENILKQLLLKLEQQKSILKEKEEKFNDDLQQMTEERQSLAEEKRKLSNTKSEISERKICIEKDMENIELMKKDMAQKYKELMEEKEYIAKNGFIGVQHCQRLEKILEPIHVKILQLKNSTNENNKEPRYSIYDTQRRLLNKIDEDMQQIINKKLLSAEETDALIKLLEKYLFNKVDAEILRKNRAQSLLSGFFSSTPSCEAILQSIVNDLQKLLQTELGVAKQNGY